MEITLWPVTFNIPSTFVTLHVEIVVIYTLLLLREHTIPEMPWYCINAYYCMFLNTEFCLPTLLLLFRNINCTGFMNKNVKFNKDAINFRGKIKFFTLIPRLQNSWWLTYCLPCSHCDTLIVMLSFEQRSIILNTYEDDDFNDWNKCTNPFKKNKYIVSSNKKIALRDLKCS